MHPKRMRKTPSRPACLRRPRLELTLAQRRGEYGSAPAVAQSIACNEGGASPARRGINGCKTKPVHRGGQRMMALNRRKLLALASCGAVGAALGRAPVAHAAEVKKTELSPDQALALLKEGNERFVANPAACFERLAERRREIALGQAPFAAVVACSDSRVPPELLFGRGLGELFVIRDAGNVLDTAGLGSIQYAVEHLGV